MKRGGELRRTPIRPVSKKRQRETKPRAVVKEKTLERAGYICEAARFIGFGVTCAGPLDAHERKSRGVYPGGHLDLENTVCLCRAHHEWVTTHPELAHACGLIQKSWEKRPAVQMFDETIEIEYDLLRAHAVDLVRASLLLMSNPNDPQVKYVAIQWDAFCNLPSGTFHKLMVQASPNDWNRDWNPADTSTEPDFA